MAGPKRRCDQLVRHRRSGIGHHPRTNDHRSQAGRAERRLRLLRLPTSLFDHNVRDEGEQDRYVNPLRIPAAVVPRVIQSKGIVMGTFGVAIDKKKNIAVPFVVDDSGPAVGEGSVALARMVAGQPISDDVTRQNRYVGQVDTPTVLWVLFGGKAAAYDHTQPDSLITGAKDAYKQWGGDERLKQCLSAVPAN